MAAIPATLNIESNVRILVMDETTNRYVVRPGKIRMIRRETGDLVEVLLDGEVRDVSLSRVYADWSMARQECAQWNEWLDKLPKKSAGSWKSCRRCRL